MGVLPRVAFRPLFFSHKDIDGRAAVVPCFAYLVLQVAFVGLFDPLRQVAEEDKRGDLCLFEHGDIFYLYVFAFCGGWRVCLDGREHHFVEFRGGYDALAVLVHLDGCIENFVYALLGNGRGENDGEIGKWRKPVADGILECLDGGRRFVFYQVPFVDAYDQPFAVPLDEREYIEVLPFDAARGVYHEYAHIGVFYGSDGAYDRIVFELFRYFALFAYACGVDQIEVETELVVPGVYGVARSACNVGDDIALLADEGIYDRGFSCVGTTYYGKARYVAFKLLGVFFCEFAYYDVEQVAGAAAIDGRDANGVA